MVCSFFLAAASFAMLAGASVDPCPSDIDNMFSEFIKVFERKYDTEEERLHRLEVFTDNLAVVCKQQALDPGAQYSHLSPLADRTREEFAALNGLLPNLYDRASARPSVQLEVTEIPDSFDWREKGAVNAVKNQQQCGSCWAFSTVANVEGANFIKTGKLLSLSEQELVDCDKKTGDNGCHGGLPTNAFKDMADNKLGLELESDYSYTASEGTCSSSQSLEKVFISSYTEVSNDEDQIAAALMKYGPLSIGINAGLMQFYKGGVAQPTTKNCDPSGLDHGVAIVAFGIDNGVKYWTIRNSWGPDWGEDGYYRIVRGTGACGLNRMVSSSLMADTSMEMIV